jgi:prophage antirepressor-like protein
MQNVIKVFETEDHHDFRTFNIDGEIWFSLADVCDSIGLQAHRRSYAEHADKLDDDEKRRVSPEFAKGMPGSNPGMYSGRYPVPLINESGLYTLVLRSDKPAAKRFRKWVTSEVLPSIRQTGLYALRPETPAFIARYNANWDRLTPGNFSIISELVIRLWGRLEKEGHIMADFAEDGTELRPDVSVGRLFSTWLKENRPEVADNFTYYYHWTDAGEFPARQYPISMLPLYIEFVDSVWIPQHSEPYFKKRDPAALPYLPKLLPTTRRSRPALAPSPGQRPQSRFAKRKSLPENR